MEERITLKEKLIALIEEDLKTLQPLLSEKVKKQRYEEAARLRDQKKYLLNLKDMIIHFE